MAIKGQPIGHRDDSELLGAAYRGDIEHLRAVANHKVLLTACDPKTGLNLLHIAVGTNNLPLTRFLVEEIGVPFKPDLQGRWPTVIAAECGVSERLNDYIVEAESAFISAEGGFFTGQGEADQSGVQWPGGFFPKDRN